MKILTANFPPTLGLQQLVLQQCLQAFNTVYPVQQILLFGSHVRGVSHADSDVDLCIVADGFTAQDQAAIAFRRAIGGIRGKPPLTLIPISPARRAEKRRAQDPFFATILQEGVPLAEAD